MGTQEAPVAVTIEASSGRPLEALPDARWHCPETAEIYREENHKLLTLLNSPHLPPEPLPTWRVF